MIKRFTLTLFVCFVSSTIFSQKLSTHLGDKQFNKFNYHKAIGFYEHALKKDSSNTYVLRKLAQSYHKIGENENASSFYEMLLNNETHDIFDCVLYGDLLREIGHYTMAIKSYHKYLEVYPDDIKIQDLLTEVKLLEKVSLLELKCEIENVGFNSAFSDFAPAIFKNSLVFSSSRKNKRFRADKYGWNGQFFLELFQFTNDDNTQKEVTRFAKGVGSKYHEGVLCFTPDYKSMFFTRNNYYHGKLSRDAKGVSNLKIFIAEHLKDSWKITGEFPYNSDDYSIGHPSLSQDGKVLYFVSDMEGGYGGTDLYRSFYKNGEWTKPENLGAEINTRENEMFPHVRHDLLFFASNGHAGLGGLDLYVINTMAKTRKLKHLGRPMNSNKDDFALVMNVNDSKGYFSSNRNGGHGDDDIYSFEISERNDVQIQIRNAETEALLIADDLLVNGKCDLNLSLNEENMIYTKSTEREQLYKLRIAKEGFITLDTSLYCGLFDAKQKYMFDLTPIPVVEEVLVNIPDSLPPIYFDFDSYKITQKANEILTHLSELFKKDEKLQITLTANTDIRGSVSYNQKLAENRVESTCKLLQEMGVPLEKIQLRVLGERMPQKRILNQSKENWHQLNRRVDLVIKRMEQ